MEKFDLSKMKQAMEVGDADAWSGLHSDDFEQIEMDDVTPPSNPKTHTKNGLYEIIKRASSNGVKFTVEKMVDGGDQIAYSVTCHIPNGRKIVSNVISDVKDGKINHELAVGARDPEK